MLLSRYTNMPELLDFFEYDCGMMLDFVHRFGGMKLKIPTPQTLAAMSMGTHIYTTLRSAETRAERILLIAMLAEVYEVTNERIRQVYKNMCKQVESDEQ